MKKAFITLASLFAILLLMIVVAAAMLDENTVKRWVSSYAERQYGRELKVTGNLKLKWWSLQPSITAEGVKLENAKWADNPWMADIGRISVRFKLLPLVLGDINLLDTEIVEGEIYLVERPTQTNWDVLLAKEKEPGYFSVKQLKEFKLSHTKVNYKNAEKNETHTLIAKNIHLQNFYSVQRQGSFHGQFDSMPVNFQIDQKPVEVEGVDRLLTLMGHIGAAEVYFTGDIADDFDWVKGRIRIKGPGETLTRIADLAALNTQRLHSYDSVATMEANIARKTIELTKINFKYGQSQMRGRLRVASKGKNTLVRGDWAFPVLANTDLNSLMKKSVEVELKEEMTDIDRKEKETQIEKKKLFDDEVIRPVIPEGLELYLQVNVKKFIGGDWTRVIQEGEGKFAIKGGRLALYPVKIRMLKGEVAIEGLIDQSDKLTAADLKIKVNNVDLKKVSESLAHLDNKLHVDEIIGGDFEGMTNLQFNGHSPQEMASSLTGNLNFIVEEGYLGSLLVEALQLDVTETFAAWLADNPKTEMNCMVALFNINSGRITTQAFVINTNDSNLVGQGVINLDNELVNYTLVTRAKDFSITGAPTKIKIEGDLINPQLDIGGEDSLLEVSAEALITPLIEGLKAIFNEHEEGKRLTHCARFRSDIVRIQQETSTILAE